MSYETIAVRLPGIGSKRVCVSCANRFYDLARTPPVCPRCGTEQPPDVPRAPAIRRAPPRRMMKAAAPTRDADDDAAPVLETDEDEDEAEADDDAEIVEDEAEEPEADAGLDEAEH